MAGDFATLADLKLHWSKLPTDREADAAQKLHEASVEIRGLYPRIDGRIASGDLDADVAKLVACRMVKRAIDGRGEDMVGVNSATAQTGPFTQTLQFTNPDGSVYLSRADKRLLAGGRSARAFTIHPGR